MTWIAFIIYAVLEIGSHVFTGTPMVPTFVSYVFVLACAITDLRGIFDK